MYLVVLAYLGFILIGMPIGIRGVIWSSGIQQEFNQPVGALGAFILANTLGYFVSSAFASRLIERLGFGNALLGSYLITGLTVFGYALTPNWEVMIALGFVVGGGLGFVDAAMNIYFAANHGPRLMNWLHASFGIGSAVAPVLLNTILGMGGGWRTGYGVIAALYGVVLVLTVFTRNRWTVNNQPSEAYVVATGGTVSTLTFPAVWMGIAIFFFYTGVELVPSDWGPRFFTAVHNLDQIEANNRISLYWFLFTLGRIFFGFVLPYLNSVWVMRLCMIGVIIGAVMFALLPSETSGAVTLVGLCLGAFAMSPLFALLITDTQERLGPQHAPNAISYQVAAASAGIGILPSLTGLFVAQSPTVVAVMWIILAVLVFALFEVSRRIKVH
jgi:fucose permease